MEVKTLKFNHDMITAIIEGKKCQTRRPIKFDGLDSHDDINGIILQNDIDGIAHAIVSLNDESIHPVSHFEYGKIGDTLICMDSDVADYLNDCEMEAFACGSCVTQKFIDDITAHLPKIKITNIRVERLQDISEEDAVAEGVQIIGGGELADTGDYCDYGYYVGELKYTKDLMNYSTTFYDEAEVAFASEIWDKLPYKPPYDWNSNPYVWVIEFEALP